MMGEEDKKARELARKFEQKMMSTKDSYDFDALVTKVSGFPQITQSTTSDFRSTSMAFKPNQMAGPLATHRGT